MSDFPTSSINSNNPKAIRNMVIPTVIESEGRVERAYDIYSRLLKDRIVFIGSEIDPYNQISNSVIAQLLFLQMQDPQKDINMYINSPGGSVSAGLAIYDTNQILSKINSELEFELPQEIVMRETQSRVNDIFTSNTERGVSEDELVEHQDQIIESAGEQANNSVKTSFILEQIADKEKIEVSQEEVLNRVDQIAARQNTSVKNLTKQLQKKNGFGRIINGLKIEKTLDFLRESAVIKEVDPEEFEQK